MAKSNFRRVFTAPLALGLMTGFGLISALLADGFWDAVAWAGLGAPLIVAAAFVIRPSGVTSKSSSN